MSINPWNVRDLHSFGIYFTFHENAHLVNKNIAEKLWSINLHTNDNKEIIKRLVRKMLLIQM